MSFKGINELESIGRRLLLFPSGFSGLFEVYTDNTRFIRVTSYRGIPMSNVTVTVNNTGGPQVATTNSEGLATIYPDIATAITINLRQYKTVRNGVAYSTTTDGLVKTIILDTQVHII